jgi:VCBS repeat-containing protein
MSRRHFAAGLNRSSATKSKGSQSRSRAERSQQKSERFVTRQMMIRQRSETRREKYINAFKRAGSAFRMWWLTLLGVMTKVVRPIVGKSLVQRGPVRRSNRPEKAFDGASRAVEFLEAKTLLTSLYVDEAVDFAPASPAVDAPVTWAGPDGVLSTGDDVSATFEPNLAAPNAAYDSIQEAIDAAAPGETINIAPGSFVGDLTIPSGKDGLVIRGAKFAFAGDHMSRDLLNGVGESTIEGFIRVSSNNVTIEGVRVLNGATLLGQNVGVYVEAENTTVTNSVFYRTGSFDLYRAVLTTLPAGTGDGLTVSNSVFEGWATGVYNNGSNDVSVTGNTFQGNNVGVSGDAYAGGNSNYDVTNNNFVNNVVEGMGLFGDTGSPWDSASSVTGNTFTGPGIFLYGDAPAAGVITGNSIEVSTTIQAAINAAFPGDEIVVAAGVYAESITINKSLAIVGANSGVTSSGSRVSETTVNGGFKVSANYVTIDGLSIIGGRVDYGFQRSGVFLEGPVSGFTLENSIVDRDGVGSESSLHGVVTTYGAATGLTLQGSSFTGWNQGLYLNPGVTLGSIDSNMFDSNGNHIIVDDPAGLAITGNTFTNAVGSQIASSVGGAVVDLEASLGLSGNNFSTSTARYSVFPYGASGQQISGTSGDDRFRGEFDSVTRVYEGAGGDDRVFGGGSTGDTARFTGNASEYTITTSAGTIVVTDNTPGRDGVDTLTGVEFLEFADGSVPVVAGTAGPDAISVVKNGSNLEVYVNAVLTLVAPLSGTTPLTLIGGDDDDTFTVDIQAIPAGGIVVTGGGNSMTPPGDTLVLTNSGAAPTSVAHSFTNASDGSVNIDGKTITYTGLEPVTDNLDVVNRTFTFTHVNPETISLTLDGGGPALFIDSTEGESVSFPVPTGSLTINASPNDILTVSTPVTIAGGTITLAAGTVTVNSAVSATSTAVNATTANINAPITGTVTGTATTVNVGTGAQIQDGVDAAAAGATLNLAAGTYNQFLSITRNLTFNGNGATINGATAPGANGVITILNSTATAIQINNVTVSNAPARHGIRAVDSTSLVLTATNVTATNNAQFGIGVAGIASLIVSGGTFNNNGQVGIYAGTSGVPNSTPLVSVTGATMSANGSYGFQKSSTGVATITNSTISGNLAHGIQVDNFGGSLTVSGSNFSGQTVGSKIRNLSATTVNASQNYWSAVSLTNPASVSFFGNVDYTPMLGSGLSLSDVYVHASGSQSGVTGRTVEGAAVVAANGTLHVLPGSYTAASNNLTVPSTVTLSPGASPGIVSLGSLTQADNSNLLIEINGPNAATPEFDQLSVTGAVTIGNSVDLNLVFGYVPLPGQSWKIVDNDLADAVVGTFAGGTSFNAVGPGGQLIPLVISYNGGDGNDIVLSVASYANVYAGSGLTFPTPAPARPSGLDQAFTLTTDSDASMSITAGDVVSFTAPGQAPVTGLIYGYQAFDTIQNAFAGAAATATIHSAGWDNLEDGTAQSVPVTSSGYTVSSFGTDSGFDGSLVINPGNTTFSFTPAGNEFGPESFNYTLTGGVKTISGKVWLNVRPVNDEPTANLNVGPFISLEDAAVPPIMNVASAIVLGPANEFTQLQSFTLNVVSGSLAFSAAPSIAANGTLSYTPAANASGSIVYEVILTDDGGTDWGGDDSKVLGQLTITVTAVNDAPVGAADSYSLNEDAVLNGTSVLGNDSDVDGPALTAVLGTGPTNGSLLLNTDGTFTYTPNPNFNGTDSFTYQATDGSLSSGVVTVTITVNAVNDAPVANPNSYTVSEDQVLTVTAPGVLGNDTDVESSPLTAILVTGPANGSLSLALDGSFVYTPSLNYNGPDSFTYKANDGAADSAPVTVTLTVTPVDDAIVANDDAYTMNEDGTLTVTAPGALGNDVNIDNDPLSAVKISNPANGTVIFNNDGSFTYTPNGNFNGTDSFSYLVSDGVTTDTAVITITVNAVNDAPVNTVPGPVTTPEDTAVAITGISVSDVDAAAATVQVTLSVTNGTIAVTLSGGALVTGGASGSATVTLQGTLTDLNATVASLIFTPTSNYNGPALLTVLSNDLGNSPGLPQTDTDTVAITVTSVNDAPVAVGESYAVLEDGTLTVAASGVLGNDTDTESSPLTAVLVTGPANGTLTLNANGSFTYTPSANYNGSDSFTYKANDGAADSNIVTVNLTVSAVNDAPVAVTDSFTLAEDTSPYTVLVLGNDSAGPSNESSQTISIVGLAGIPPELAGTFTVVSGTTLIFTPPANYSGTAVITYTIRDNGQSAAMPGGPLANDFKESTATVTLVISPVSDAPALTVTNVSGNEDTAIALPITVALTDLTETLSGITISGIPAGSVLTNTALDTLTISGASITLTQSQLAGLAITPPVDSSGMFTLGVSVSSTDSPDAPATTTGTINVTVNAVNDAPVNTVPGPVTTPEDTAVAITGISLSDVDAAAATVQVALTVTNGTIAVTLSGGASVFSGASGSATVTLQGTLTDLNATVASLIFTPTSNYNGPALLTVLSSDLGNTGFGGAQTDSDTVAITVTPVNDAPVAASDSYTVAEDGTLTVAASGVLGNDTDTESNPLTAVLVTGPANGTLTLNANGSFTYTPNANYNGPDSFTYKANDGAADSNIVTVNLTVDAVNDAPVATDASVGTIENTPTTFDLTLIVSDVETPDSGLVFALVGPAPNTLTQGTLTVNANGTWSFSPVVGFVGTVMVQYSVTDLGDGLSPALTTTKNLSIVVSPFNDPPVNSVPGAQTTNEDTPVVFSSGNGNLISVSDPDVAETPGGELSVQLTVTNGVLILTPAGVTITAGASGTSTVTIQGVPAAINATLNGLTYSPTANFSGSALLTIVTNDLGNTGAPNAQSDTDTVAITVNAVNDAPVAAADAYPVVANAVLNVSAPGVLGNDSDVESSPLSVSQINGSAPNVGTEVTLGSGAKVTLNADGSFSYNPNGAFDVLGAGQTATDSFTYTVNDGTVDGNTVTVTLTITGVNDKPTGGVDTASTPEDNSVAINVLANDSDIDDDLVGPGLGGVIDPTTVAIVSGQGPSHGTVIVNPMTGVITYSPAANYNGPDSFKYTVKDDVGLESVPITVNVTVTPVNDAPVAVANSYTTNEDSTLSVPVGTGLLVNDSDIDGDSLTAVLVSGASSGSVFLSANGSFIYTPAANFNGTATFTYRASDGLLPSNIVTVTITITAVNDAPVAVADSYTVAEDGTLTVALPGVLGNDTDIDSGSLTADLVTTVAHGTLTLNANGSFTYLPAANYNGPDSFTYRAFDGASYSAPVTVNLTVTAVNDAPVAVADTYSTPEGSVLNVSLPGVLGNDTDVDGPSATASLVTGPVKGLLALNSDGSFSYNPNGQFESLALGESENVTFVYQVTDGSLTSQATVTITVQGENDKPTATGAFYTIIEDQVLNGTVSGSDTDTTDVLTYLVSLAPSNGTLTLNANGTFTYTPNANFNGADAFSFIARDNSGAVNEDSIPAIVVITITSVNDAPVNTVPATNLNTDENTALAITSISVFDLEAPVVEVQLTVDSGDLSVILSGAASITAGASGSDDLTISGSQIDVNATLASLVFTPDSGFNGLVALTVLTSDLGSSGTGGTLTDSDTVTIEVGAVNDAPVADGQTVTVNEDGSVSITLTGSDADMDPLTFSVTGGPMHGTLSGTAPNLTYTPNPDYNGTDSFTFTVNDGTVDSVAATVSITVNEVNDAPVLTLPVAPVSIAEGQSVALDTLISVTDVDASQALNGLTLVVTAPKGSFTVSGTPDGSVMISMSGTVVTLAGTLAEINADLALITFGNVDADPGTGLTEAFSLSVSVTDGGDSLGANAETTNGSIAFNAADVGPTVMMTTLQSATVTEGTVYTVTLSGASDPAGLLNDPITAGQIFWGDGTSDSLTPTQIANLNNGVSFDLTHLFDDEKNVNAPHDPITGSQITLSLFSAGALNPDSSPKEFGSVATLPITVTGVAPTGLVVIGGPYAEGTTGATVSVTSIVDPSLADAANLLFSYDFGNDGIFEYFQVPLSSVPIPDSFLTDDPGALVSVFVQDKDGLFSSSTVSLSVTNVAPVITALSSDTAATNVAYSRSITFVDPGTDVWTATVDFGDGTGPQSLGVVGKTFNLNHTFTAAGTFTVSVTVNDGDGGTDTKTFSITVTSVAFVAGRKIFYSGSSFDANGVTIDTDAGGGYSETTAIATDKTALLPGQTATFANYTGYSLGINGIMVDLANLPGTVTAADFIFRVGNDNNPAAWANAPAPTAIELIPGAGDSGSTRVVITWANNAIAKGWLQVVVKANANTGLAAPDVHYWGNWAGETGTSPGETRAQVNILDQFQTRAAFAASVPITNSFDFNHDGAVNILDQLIARNSFTNPLVVGNEGLLLIAPPVFAPSSGGFFGSFGSTSALDNLFGTKDDDFFDLL